MQRSDTSGAAPCSSPPNPPKAQPHHHQGTDADLAARIATEEAAKWAPFAVALGARLLAFTPPAGAVIDNSRL